jgi:hypothetical protein
MMKLQKSTDFAGEASAAVAMIDKLCAKHGITLKEATEVIINDDVFSEFKRMNSSYAVLLNSVANFYDAIAYISQKENQKEFKVLGSEAQQIQVQLYFEYLMEVMNRECNLAYKGEKILCELTDKKISRSFKTNFKKAFAYQIQNRLKELKQKENRVHEDREAVQKAVSMLRFNNTRKMTGATGAGASVGAEAGSSVSLNRQTNSSNVQHALCGV